jgi:hypothetical protein
MKHAVEMGSGAMIYVSSFRKIGSSIQKLIRGGTQTTKLFHKPTAIFLNKDSRLKMGAFARKGGFKAFVL